MENKIFEEIGFSQGEVKVYFALIKLGESTIGPLAKESRVTAAKVYPILDKLKEKGLITYVIKSGTKYFQAFNPKRILDYLNEKKKKINEQEEEMEKILPEIISRTGSETKQSATIYESLNGLKTLYDEMLEYMKKTKEDFIAFTMGEEYKSEEINRFFDYYDTKRKELGIKIKLIGIEYQREFFKKVYKPKPYIQIKFLPYTLPRGVIIFSDKIAILSWEKVPTAFVIQSKTIAESYKKFFWDMWKIAKK
jgi:sugar-specific transcriptional regulator TrmB